MRITDLATFRGEFSRVWSGADALLVELAREVFARVRVDELAFDAKHLRVELSVTDAFGLPQPPAYTVGGKWTHIEANTTVVVGSPLIGGWRIWQVEAFTEALVEASRTSPQGSARLEALREAYLAIWAEMTT